MSLCFVPYSMLASQPQQPVLHTGKLFASNNKYFEKVLTVHGMLPARQVDRSQVP